MIKSVNYCLPIIKSKRKEVLKMIEQNMDYDFFEIWLDYIEDLDLEFVSELIFKLRGKSIFLFRRQNLEKIKMPLDERFKIIDLLEGEESFLDLDILTQKEEVEYGEGKKIRKILSYHNYQETPADDVLETLVKEMRKYKADILKLSTLCKYDEDGLRLLKLLLKLKKEGLEYIVLGMGEKGLITRIFGALWGNKMSFAPISLDESSADGQLTKTDLEKIFERI